MTVQDKLALSFKKYKDNIALKTSQKTITYAQLEQESACISQWIHRNGIGKGTYIGIYTYDSAAFITAAVGILMAGCVYVPLDPYLDAETIKKMMRLTCTETVFCLAAEHPAGCLTFPAEVENIGTFFLEEILSAGISPEKIPSVDHGREDIAYIQFTRLSGEVHAVSGLNKSLSHLIERQIETFGIGETDRVGQVSPPGSGPFLIEVFPALCAGAVLHIQQDFNRPFIFMFSGLGAQYVSMGLGLYRSEPVFREAAERCFDILKNDLDYPIDIKAILYPSEQSGNEEQYCCEEVLLRMGQFDVAQMVIFIFEYALATLLIKSGIRPHAMIGYSFGEYAAACISGVFSLKDALRVIAARGKLLMELPEGAMTSVPLPKERLQELLPPGISIAIDNGPACIVAGPVDAVKQFEKELKKQKLLTVPLASTRAVHSAMMEPVLEKFAETLGTVKLNKPGIPFISNVTGDWISEEEALDPGYWVRQLREPVQFADGLRALIDRQPTVFVEIGPGSDLSALLLYHTSRASSHTTVNTVRNPNKNVSDGDFFHTALSRLQNRGVSSKGMVRWIGKNYIKLLVCSPRLFHLLNPEKMGKISAEEVDQFLKALRHVLLLDENDIDTILPSHLKRWYERFGERIQLVRLFGTAETTVVKMVHYIRPEDAQKDTILIGTPVKGARAAVFDGNMKLCAQGITGDIYIRTPFRTAGYCNDPKLTAQRFVPNPFSGNPDDLICKTGFKGKILPDGTIELSAQHFPISSGSSSVFNPAGVMLSTTEYKAPTNEIEEKLVTIWSKILKKEHIGIQDDFFESQGHSLGIMAMAAEIYKTFNVEMTVPQLFRMPRIEDIAGYIKAVRNRGKKNGEAPEVQDEDVPYFVFNQTRTNKIFLFPPKIAYGMEYKELSNVVDHHAFYAFNFIEDQTDLPGKYADLIAGIQPQPPYIFLGYSAGGNLAFEVVKQMEKKGRQPIHLIIMDSFTNREIEGLTQPGQQDNYLNFVLKNLETRGLGFLKEKVSRRMKNYGAYLDSLETNGQVETDIHFITAEGRKVSNDWRPLTTGKFNLYTGFGRHIQMLDPGVLEKNAKIIDKILNTIGTKEV